jgi:hypothetical protein
VRQVLKTDLSKSEIYTSPTPTQNRMNTPLIAKKNGKYIVCLPVEGNPYIRHISPPVVAIKKLVETVQGPFQKTGRTSFVIHPMFRQEKHRWDIAQRLLEHENTEVYVNEEGAYACSPNFATILTYRSSCPHFFGEIALVVSKSVLEKMIDPLEFQEEDDEDEDDDDEDDDDELEKSVSALKISVEKMD